jgi:hypothetical protein
MEILGQKWNGRVNVMTPPSGESSPMWRIRNPNLTSTTLHNPLDGIVDQSNLSRAFFSRDNTQIIQNGLRKAIYDKSNGQYLIGEQDVDELHIIMRATYLQFARNLVNNVTAQIVELNKMVLNFCIQQVYGECQGRMKYLNDVSTLVVPIAPPINSSNTDRELILQEWF